MRARCMLKENVENKLNMTREDQIAIASCAYGNRGSSIDFEAGARWADNHPRQEVVDLLRIWHPSSEKPQENKQVIAINLIYTVYGGFYDADRDIFILQNKCLYMRWSAIKCWAYLNDLLPKGGIK